MEPLNISSSLLLLLLLSSASVHCNPSPSGRSQSHGIMGSSQNPFDGGAVGSCEVPVTNYCSVNYPVPTSIARLAGIIEDRIRNDVSQYVQNQENNRQTCNNTLKDVLCNLEFPRCLNQREELYMEVALNSQNCSVLVDACPGGLGSRLESLCNNLAQTTVPAGGCRPIAELAGDFSFNLCQYGNMETTLVTEWMFEYMKHADLGSGGILYNNPNCGQNLATFMCNFGGQCTEDGLRVKFINTHEICNEVLSW